MKRIEDLEHDDLIKLTDEEVQRYIEIELAENGVMPKIPPKEINLENAGIVKDQKFYKVGELLFKNREDAVKIAGMDIYKSDYDYSIGYDYRWCEKQVETIIEEVYYYKKVDVVSVASVIQANKEKKSAYDEQKSEYDKYLSRASKFREFVWNIVNEAHEKERSIKNCVECFNKYKDLADGDMSTAIRFFQNTFKEESAEIKEFALRRLGVDFPVEAEDLCET